jgi:hypothetical protein
MPENEAAGHSLDRASFHKVLAAALVPAFVMVPVAAAANPTPPPKPFVPPNEKELLTLGKGVLSGVVDQLTSLRPIFGDTDRCPPHHWCVAFEDALKDLKGVLSAVTAIVGP